MSLLSYIRDITLAAMEANMKRACVPAGVRQAWEQVLPLTLCDLGKITLSFCASIATFKNRHSNTHLWRLSCGLCGIKCENTWLLAATSNVVMEAVIFTLGPCDSKEHYQGRIRGLCFSNKEKKITPRMPINPSGNTLFSDCHHSLERATETS